MEKAKLTEKILLRIDKVLKDKVSKSAIKNNRSLNSEFITVLKTGLNAAESKNL